MITVRFNKSGVSGIGRRELRTIGKAAMAAPAALWIQRYLPLHFMRTAHYRYQYKHRTQKYRRYKLSKGAKAKDGTPSVREDKPLVFTGRSRESALNNNSVSTVAPNYQRYEARITMPAPVLNYLGLQEELTRVIPPEIKQMEIAFQREFENELNKRGRTTGRKTYRAAA